MPDDTVRIDNGTLAADAPDPSDALDARIRERMEWRGIPYELAFLEVIATETPTE